MERQRQFEHEQGQIKINYVTHKHLDAVIPQLQKTMDEVRGDIKKLLVLVHNTNGKTKTESN